MSESELTDILYFKLNYRLWKLFYEWIMILLFELPNADYKTEYDYYIVSVLQVSSVKKFIKNVTPHVVNLFFYLSFTAFFSINLNVKRNYIHTFSWTSLLKSHFFPSYELHISLTQDRCALTRSEYAWLNFWGDWFNKLHSALWYFYSPTYINVRVKC